MQHHQEQRVRSVPQQGAKGLRLGLPVRDPGSGLKEAAGEQSSAIGAQCVGELWAWVGPSCEPRDRCLEAVGGAKRRAWP